MLVEQLGEHLLVELGVHLAPSQRHLRDRAHARAGTDAHAAKRRDHAAPGGLREVEARGLRREEVGDVARDQRARGGHADEDRARPGADRRARLVPERGVRLVADDDRVGARDLARVAHEPLVGLDRDGALRGVLALQQRPADALRVAALAQLAEKLVDEVAAVGEDQHAARARRLDEAERGDRLARSGGVLEPEALRRVRVLGAVRERLVFGLLFLFPVARLLLVGFVLELLLGARPRARTRGLLLGDLLELRFELVLLLLGLLLVLLVFVLVLLVQLARTRTPALAVARQRSQLCALVRGRCVELERRGDDQLGRAQLGGAAVAVGGRCASASSATSVPESASTWCEESIVPSASLGSSSESSRSRPSSSENWRRHAVDGMLHAFVELGERLVERATARRARAPARRAASSPSCRNLLAHELLRARDIGGTDALTRPKRPLTWSRPLQAVDCEMLQSRTVSLRD